LRRLKKLCNGTYQPKIHDEILEIGTITWREATGEKLPSRFARVRVHVVHRDYWLADSRPEEWTDDEKEPIKYWLSTLLEDAVFRQLVTLRNCDVNSLAVCLLGGDIAKGGMQPLTIVQQGLRTPTGPVFASFCIVGIRGLGFGFASMRRSTRQMAPFSGARCAGLTGIVGWKFRPGCSTARLALMG